MGVLRLLPLLILVAMLTFSVRIVDVVTGVQSMNGQAIALQRIYPQPEPDQASLKSSLENPLEALEPAAGEEDEPEKEMTEDFPEGEDITQWRDASDPEFEYANLRMEMFDDLVARRKSLETREQALQMREALLKAGEQELKQKFDEMTALRGQIEALLKQQSDEEAARIKSLVIVYEGMKPKQAAGIFDTLDLDVLIEVMSQMSERKLSPILAAMNTERARTVTIMLAEQKKLPELNY